MSDESGPCEGSGWVWDESSCGDPDCCSPKYGCACNPDYDYEHECDTTCHPEEPA